MKTWQASVIALIIFPFPVVAGKATNPIQIEAQHVHANIQSGITVYNKNVVIDGQSFHLEADKVTEYREGGEIVRLVAIGKPVMFREKGPRITISDGKAEVFEYLLVSGKVNLKDFVLTDTNGNVQRGSTGTYEFGTDR